MLYFYFFGASQDLILFAGRINEMIGKIIWNLEVRSVLRGWLTIQQLSLLIPDRMLIPVEKHFFLCIGQ